MVILKSLGRRPQWIVAVALILACAIWFFYAGDSTQDNAEVAAALPFQVESDLNIAGSSQPVDSGSLRLICTTTHELRLLLEATLPKREYLQVSDSATATLFVDRRIDEELLLESAELVAMGKVDTVATEPLSEEQVSKLARLTNETGMKRFSFMVFERGVFLLGQTDGATIEDFARRCRAQP